MIWDFKNILTKRLMIWAGVNIAAGLGMILLDDAFWKALGLQLVAWGVIEGCLSWLWLRRIKKQLGHRSSVAEEEKEADRMRKRLWIINALCVVLAAGGAAPVYFMGVDSLRWLGTGCGVILQGAFLFIFSMQHALRVPDPLQLPHLPLFTHPDHEPFLFEGGEPGAVLVHGFPGTALEMRPLGRALRDADWTASGMRLPGFGPELANVVDYNNEAWVRSIQEELKTMRKASHNPLLLVGYSFGGGLAVQAAAREAIDGLVLIAPVTWREPAGAKVILDFARALLPLKFQPFQHIPIVGSHPLNDIKPFFPEINFENPEQTREFQHLQFPFYILNQLREVGREALAAAPFVHSPTLLIQGKGDKVIQPSRTVHLRDQLGGSVTYEIVDGAHHLTMPHHPAFNDVVEKVLSFAAQIISSNKESVKD